ncbi:DUF5719 family protein [Streptomyces sp. NPDC050560]|uniref:DUF5719 family protein n=1 Tax=Streptomyces sp. NPDC050560 TaxID=3365630 RepID=UPI00379E5D37
MNRSTISLIAGAAALAVVTGIASASAPDGSGGDTATAAARRPVQRSSLLCPAPSPSDEAETDYTSYTPPGDSSGGKAALTPAEVTKDTTDDGDDKSKDDKGDKGDGKGDSKDDGDGTSADDGTSTQSAPAKPFLTAAKPGTPATGEKSGASAPGLIGSADGALAPGWTVQQTTRITVGPGRGLLGLNCSAPDTDFWFPGASTADERSDYVNLTNPDDSAAVADIELYGKGGALASEVGEGIQVRPHQTVSVLLSTLTDKPETNLTVHVTVRTGRVAAAVQSSDEDLGADWIAPAAAPAPRLVLPGIPKDATSARLVAFAPGDSDADLKIKLATANGTIAPAGHESLHVKAGMTAAVDLGAITRDEPGSLLLTPADGSGTPVVAALRVVRGKGDKQESAFIPATSDMGARTTAADNRAKGSTLDLVAPDKAAKVRVTASAGSKGGKGASKTYDIKAGTTAEIAPPVPSGLKGSYALTVEHLSGGPVYATRQLEVPDDGVPMFTVQPLPDDHGTVEVPSTEQDLSILQK